jgi:FKBP-type peptidyl-prolyl cis-trans isomerase 2
VGQEFLAEDVSDAGVATGADPIHVVRVDEDAVVFDANAPLAGCVLTFDVTVRDVRPATDAEVEHAARALEAAEHSAGAAPRDPPSAPDVAAIALRRSRR